MPQACPRHEDARGRHGNDFAISMISDGAIENEYFLNTGRELYGNFKSIQFRKCQIIDLIQFAFRSMHFTRLDRKLCRVFL